MKHIHIVDPYQSAAMQRMTWPLDELKALYEITKSGEVDITADLNLHVPWHTLAGLEELGEGKHIAVYTHCNAGDEAKLLDACERADIVTCMSFTGREELITLGADPKKLWVIYAGADGFFYRRRTIGIVGYPQPNGRKRESLLLDLAWQYDLSAYQFLFLGLNWDELAEQLKSLGVSVAGVLHADTPEQIARAYHVMDYLLVTGYKEGGPLPLLEAIASGVKVFSPRFGYASDLLDEEYLYDTPEELMRKLKEDISESVTNHQLVKANTWADYAAEYALIIGRLLGESVDLYPSRGMSRYAQLLDIIDDVKPERICEIGTWNGKRAIQMIQEAQRFGDVSYQGFDLFDLQTPADIRRELSKGGWPQEIVHKLISATGAGVELVSGDTSDTLSESLVDADLYFVDGGHSEETIENDGLAVLGLLEKGVAVFDDYYHAGKPEGMGCNQFIDSLGPMWEVTHLPVRTETEAGMTVGMVKVRRNADIRLQMQSQTQTHSLSWNDGRASYSLPFVRNADAPGSTGC